MGVNVLERLSDPQIVALRCKGDAWPHALLSATPIPDAWMGLIVRPDGRRRFVPAGEDPRPDYDDTLILVRNRPLTVPLELKDVPAASEHTVSAALELLFRVPARDDELAAFARTLVADAELTLQRLADEVCRAGAPAVLRAFVGEQPADKLVRDDSRVDLLARLQAGLQRFLFGGGLVLERLGRLEFASRDFTQQAALARDAARRVKELEARDLVERAASAATHRRIADLSDIFTKLKNAAAAGSDLRWHELLPALTPGERGRFLENLWRVTPDHATAQAVVAVTDQTCVWLDPTRPEDVSRRCDLPPDLGGARSVGYDPARGWLLVGATSGVWALAADDGQVIRRFAVLDAERPKMGFNSATIAGDRLVATHSQLGCWSWPTDDPAAGAALLRPSGGTPQTVRAAAVTLDGHIVFAADDEVHVHKPGGERRHTIPIGHGSVQDLAVVAGYVYAATSTGIVLRGPWETPDVWEVLHRRSGAIESLQTRCWDDLVEVVIPAGADGIAGVYGEEGLLVQLMTAGRPIRRAWACDDLLVGLDDLRDRLVLLHGAMAGRLGREIPLAGRLGRSIQDACIVTSRATPPPDDKG